MGSVFRQMMSLADSRFMKSAFREAPKEQIEGKDERGRSLPFRLSPLFITMEEVI